MTSIDNRTLFACAEQFVREHLGRRYRNVVTLASFSCREGRLLIAAEQTPVQAVPEYFCDPLSSPLKYGGDFVPNQQQQISVDRPGLILNSDEPMTVGIKLYAAKIMGYWHLAR